MMISRVTVNQRIVSRASRRARSYFTKEERIALLKEYQDKLEKEKQGINERIKVIEAS